MKFEETRLEQERITLSSYPYCGRTLVYRWGAAILRALTRLRRYQTRQTRVVEDTWLRLTTLGSPNLWLWRSKNTTKTFSLSGMRKRSMQSGRRSALS